MSYSEIDATTRPMLYSLNKTLICHQQAVHQKPFNSWWPNEAIQCIGSRSPLRYEWWNQAIISTGVDVSSIR